MSLLTTIFGPGIPRPRQFPDAETCPHERLMARFRDRSAQLDEAPMGFKCQRCYSEFLPFDPVVKRWQRRMAAAKAAAQSAEAPAGS